MQDLKITLVQSYQHWEDVDANLSMFAEKLQAIQDETDIILLPEMFSTGFSMNAKDLAEPAGGKAFQWMKAMAAEKNAVITGSIMTSDDGKYYNRLVWMRADGSFEIYNKRHLFSMAGEEKVYTPGTEKLLVEVKGWKICPMVCYDLRFPVWIRNTQNYEVLLLVANWPERRAPHWRKLLQARAIENQCYVIGLNRVGTDGNSFPYSGNSMAVDTQGEIMTEITGEEKTETVTLVYESLELTRRYMPFLNDMDAFALQIED